jgi:hypothetical protein
MNTPVAIIGAGLGGLTLARVLQAGLFEEFLEIIHPGGQATRVHAKEGNVLLDESDDGRGGRPEVPSRSSSRLGRLEEVLSLRVRQAFWPQWAAV